MSLLTGKTAIITGATRGIGKAIALKFAKEGANIAFTDLAPVIEQIGADTEKEIAAWAQLNERGITVGVDQGSAAELTVRELLPQATVAYFTDKFMGYTAVAQGKIDAFVYDRLQMQLAIEEVGVFRLLFAAACSAITKPFGIRGVFYRIAGTAARAIDGPCDCTIPPYNHYAKKAPKDPDQVARRLAGLLGCRVVIIDANDLGVEVLGRSSSSIPTLFCKQVFRDNPLGQSRESTPLCVVRRAR